MKLYWKDIEIRPGMMLKVIEQNYEVVRSDGTPAEVQWEIIDIKERGPGHDLYEPEKDKTYPLKKVMSSKRLYRKKQAGKLVQIPPCAFYLIIEEYHDGEPALMRCYNVDMLELVRHVEIV